MRLDLLAALAGLLLPLAFAPFGYGGVAVVSLMLLFSCWRGADPRTAFRRGYWFGLGQFGFGIYWIFISLHDYGGASPVTAVLLTALLVAFLALYPAAVGWLARRGFRTSSPAVQLVWLFPAAWVVMEWLRGWFLTGLPWLLVGYTQTDTPLRGIAPVLGTFGVSLATAMLAGLLAAAAVTRGWVRRFVLVGILALLGLAATLNRICWTGPAGEPFLVAVLQGNIPQNQKWLPEAQRATIQMYVDLTREHYGARLIVWPETAIPAFYQNVELVVVPELEAEARRHGSDLLIGVPYFDRETEGYFNAVVALGQQRGFYFKRHLVPFGEYLPLRPLLGFMLDLLEIPLSDFSAGSDRQPLVHAAGYPVAITICYEDIFGQEALMGLPDAAYLVNVTNDAWFGDSIAPHQHWQMARMRAIETGRYMVRATNTGVSGVIAADGSPVGVAPMFRKTGLEAKVTPMQGQTPYARFGDWPVLSVVLAVFLAVAAHANLGPSKS